MTLPRYPEYRASGVEWLGEVPSHWVAMRLRDIASFKGGGTPSKDVQEYWAGDIPWLSPKDFGQTVIVDTEDHITIEAVRASATSMRPAGEVFLVARSGILKHTIPVAISPIPLAINQDVKAIALNSQQCMSWFFVRWVQGFNKYLLREWCKQGATVESLEHQYLEQTIICLPPLPEQHAIVAYLDRKTARIDDLIDKKRRLLALLTERRTAIITHAVTKGLPTEEARAAGLPVDPPMKQSGVEWIGEVPAHWGTVPIWHIADFVNGAVFPPAEWATEGTPIVRISNLNGSDSFNYSRESVSKRFHVNFGDLLFGWSGNRGTSFGPFIWKNHGLHYLNQHIFKVYSKNVSHEYLYWILKAVTEVIESEAHGIIGMVHITATKLGSIRVPLPSLAEQAAIGDYLVRETARLDDLAAKVEIAIAALGEYRTALITAAVTGQVDVRGAVEAW